MRRSAIVLLVLVVAVGAFLFFPRGGNLSIATAATLTVLHGQVDAQKTGADFAPAFDGDLLTGGDVVRADAAGNAVVTFFDGSTLTVESGSQVKVASLTKTSSGGIQVSIEQTLGRTWASVQKLAPGSTFEIKTPTSTAAVRGTAFETVVETVNGVTTTTIKTTEGQVLVQAASGGQTTVGPGQEVQVPQGAPAPANPTPQTPTARLRFTPSANVGFTIIDPRGLQCSTAVRQVPGCDFAGTVVSIDGPVAGTYSIALTAAAPSPGATLTVDGTRGTANDFSTKFTTNLAVGDLVRTTLQITAPAVGALATSAFTAAELVTSVCGAEATGRVFSSGDVGARGDALAAYGRQAAKQPAAIVVSASELTLAAADGVRNANLPVPVSGVTVTIDGAGLHLNAQASAGPLTVPATANVIAGAHDGKLFMKTRDLDLGPIPGTVKDQLISALDRSLTDFSGSFPLVVDRVAFRNGCLAVIGTTP
ncbi:MAG TPA: FecR family protein [Candidatus Limnocylindria bacterium]